MGKRAESFIAKGPYLYSEALLAKHLGIPRKNLTDARLAQLRKHLDYDVSHGEIALSLRGIARLLVALEIPAGRVDVTACYFPTPEKNGPPLLLCDRGQPAGPVKMRVRRLFPNPNLIEATEVDRPLSICRVRVKSHANLIIGMHFDAIPDPGNPGFWMLTGHLPRFRGRW